MGWVPDAQYVDSPRATPEQLARFHAPDYNAAVLRAEAEQALPPEMSERYQIGRFGNPIYPEVFRRPATSSGASIHAADLLRYGGVVHSMAGGTHHGRADRASGFCFFNDPVLGILRMLDNGVRRIFYLDIDAHHGDGVQDAFADDDRVFTFSIHEANRWPRSGPVDDRAGGQARNAAVPFGLNDSEFAAIIDRAALPLLDRFEPEAIVLQCGVDGLADDPQSRMELSNNAHWRVVSALKGRAPRLLVLGGGGYNPWSVARGWAGVWATLNGHEIPDRLPEAAQSVLRALSWQKLGLSDPPDRWLTRLRDAENHGEVRPEIEEIIDALVR
jgi:acetoin utilization protein AcuC